MRTRRMFLVLFAMVVMIAGTTESRQTVVDLTHTISSNTVYWPGNPPYNLTILHKGNFRGFWLESNYIAQAEHGGTHFDAPAHIGKGKWHAHEIPASRLVGPAVIINVTMKAATNKDYLVQVSDLKNWEIKYGKIPDGAIVVMKSGWGPKYPSLADIFNTKNLSDTTSFHFPGFHPEAATWLMENRNISMVGSDTPSVDNGQSQTIPAHRIFYARNVPGLENVGHLEEIPESGATIFIGSIKTMDGSGGPARIIALIDDDASSAVAFDIRSVFGVNIIISFAVSVLLRL